MHPARQILCIHLPHWSITRCCRRHPEFRNAAIAIIHSIGQRRQVVDASERARSLGVRENISSAEARALCGQLICIERDNAGDRRSLCVVGRWMMRFTPVVANGWDDAAQIPVETAVQTPPAALFLDLTGCDRLFRGIDAIVRQVRQSLTQFSIPAQMAVAPTPGAAWAFAFAGKSQDKIIDALSLSRAIEPLPIKSLRLDEEITADLYRLGLHRVDDLLAIPRDQFPSRFGPSLLMRLDQLTGERIEPLTRLINEAPITAKMKFDAPIESVEDIGLIFEKLLDLVLADLTRRNHGVRQLRMILKPDRGWGRPTIARTIALSRPHRDRKTLIHLIRCEMERVDCENGFIRFQLDVPLHEPVNEAQTQLFEQQHAEEQMELDRLFQRLLARLGEAAVIRPELVESYLPERAWRPAKDDGPAVFTPTVPPPPRPLTLFQMPVEIRVICEPSDDRTGQPRQLTWQGNVHRLTYITGPERIAGEWWRGHNRTRDYYEVEDEGAHRFWIFRVVHEREDETVTTRWFLHGRFN